jgi:hypothetical protein
MLPIPQNFVISHLNTQRERAHPGEWIDIYLHWYNNKSIDFCFRGINSVHLTVFAVPSW